MFSLPQPVSSKAICIEGNQISAAAEPRPFSVRSAYMFLTDGESGVCEITYGELDRRARAIGAWLQSLGAQSIQIHQQIGEILSQLERALSDR